MFLQKGEATMKIQPTLDEVKTTAAAGRYDVLPVSCEILADICTPIEALKILKNVSTHCYLLESAQPSEKWGRYTFLGLDPKMEITCRNGVMKAGELLKHKTPRRCCGRFWPSTKVRALHTPSMGCSSIRNPS